MLYIRLTAKYLPVLLLAALLPAHAQSTWEVTKTLPIGGEGSWDYLTVDPQTHRLFVVTDLLFGVVGINFGVGRNLNGPDGWIVKAIVSLTPPAP